MLGPDELERMASRHLASNAFDFFRTGARDELTVRANRRAWASWHLVPRILVDVTEVDLRSRVLTTELELPLMVAPMSLQRLAHPDGELAMATAAAQAGSLMVVSMGTSTALEEIARVAGLKWWFQLYALRDRKATSELVHRAVGAGASAIVITVDSQAGPTQRRPRGGLVYPPGISEALVHSDAFRGEADRAFDWRSLGDLQESAGVPIVLKGVLHPDDADRAATAGVQALVVSNHGGRSLDGALPTAHALPDVVAAARGRLEIYVDGGIRRGADILRALALGARAVLVGRPFMWGLAMDGSSGVDQVFRSLRTELEVDAALCGVTRLSEVPRDLVRSDCSCSGRP